MSRRYWRGGHMPFMYMQQPVGWAEQIIGMGYGQRSNRAPSFGNDLFGPYAGNNTTDSALDLDTLSSLFTRLILQNHLTRLAGDVLGRGSGGGALWGCSLPSAPSTSSSSCSACQPHSNHHHSNNSQGCGSSNVDMCGHTNNINVACMCHTCPAATRPHMDANNVFIIPTGHVQYQHQQQQHQGPAAASLNLTNNLNMFFNGLGLALDASCGGGSPVSLSPNVFVPPVLGAGMGAPVSQNAPIFSCNRCNFQML